MLFSVTWSPSVHGTGRKRTGVPAGEIRALISFFVGPLIPNFLQNRICLYTHLYMYTFPDYQGNDAYQKFKSLQIKVPRILAEIYLGVCHLELICIYLYKLKLRM